MNHTHSVNEVLIRYGLSVESGTQPESLPAISGNAVISVRTPTGRAIVRCSNPTRTRTWLKLEADVLSYLADIEFPSVRQLRTPNDQPFVEHDGYLWSVFDFVDGTMAKQPSNSELVTLAQTQAGLHIALDSMPDCRKWRDYASSFRLRKSWAYIVPLAATRDFVDWVEIHDAVAAAEGRNDLDEVKKHLQECVSRIDDITADLPELPGILTHYDYGQYNVLFNSDGVATVIDFDLLSWESPTANLARGINMAGRAEWMGGFLADRASNYLAAYNERRRLSLEELTALPLLMRLFVLQYPIFHALLYLEAIDDTSRTRWAQAMAHDLVRDAELGCYDADWPRRAIGRD
jgi:Ser/Thr protein kinase RdoA (MazF antagonist)